MDNPQNNSSSFLTPFSAIQEEETTNLNNFCPVSPNHDTKEKTEIKLENWNSIDGLDDLKTNIEVVETENKPEIVEIEPEKPPTPTPEAKTQIDKEKIKSTILLMQSKLNEILNLLDADTIKNETISTVNSYIENGHNIVEGSFNGMSMVGPDGHEYSVPANYASKSRLVDGDTLKLTIKENGSFVYKQIKPIERKRITGTLVHDEENDQWVAMNDGKSLKVLNASISFYKGKSGDDVVLLVPKERESEWGAVENIIKKIF